MVEKEGKIRDEKEHETEWEGNFYSDLPREEKP